ncbi:MAG: PTS sugar transporter subunit IIA [Weissella hellenica]|uniref:PTS sugar transporter subunit IIA n=1 Tax=Weissella hellenica TaxID=46256 RepID=UPI0038884816
MVKLEFLSMAVTPTMPMIAHLTAQRFKLNENHVKQAMFEREDIGSTVVAPGISIPHVELANIKTQGLFLIKDKQQLVLVLIVDKLHPDEQLIKILQGLLEEQSLEKLSNITSEQAFKILIEGVENRVVR